MIDGVVALIGRPNVGKSTLFNRLIKTRLSIVDDQPGVTRDRLYGKVEWKLDEMIKLSNIFGKDINYLISKI